MPYCACAVANTGASTRRYNSPVADDGRPGGRKPGSGGPGARKFPARSGAPGRGGASKPDGGSRSAGAGGSRPAAPRRYDKDRKPGERTERKPPGRPGERPYPKARAKPPQQPKHGRVRVFLEIPGVKLPEDAAPPEESHAPDSPRRIKRTIPAALDEEKKLRAERQAEHAAKRDAERVRIRKAGQHQRSGSDGRSARQAPEGAPGRKRLPKSESRDAGEFASGLMRINRALSLAGLGSRRAVEELITGGKVAVNGKTVTDLSTQVDPQKDSIAVDGKAVRFAPLVYYAFYKPRGVVTTMKDERGRESVAEHIRKAGIREPVKPVGRLDRRSEGLLLLTNDGALAMRLTHPSGGVKKTYLASLDRRLTEEDGNAFLSGVELEDGPGKFDSLEFVRDNPDSVVYRVSVREGRNRLVRRIFGAKGYVVKRLVRTEFGGLKVTGLKSGELRKLTAGEIEALRKAGK